MVARQCERWKLIALAVSDGIAGTYSSRGVMFLLPLLPLPLPLPALCAVYKREITIRLAEIAASLNASTLLGKELFNGNCIGREPREPLQQGEKHTGQKEISRLIFIYLLNPFLYFPPPHPLPFLLLNSSFRRVFEQFEHAKLFRGY